MYLYVYIIIDLSRCLCCLSCCRTLQPSLEGGIGRTGPGYKALPLVSRRPRAPAPGCSEVEGEREREREREEGWKSLKPSQNRPGSESGTEEEHSLLTSPLPDLPKTGAATDAPGQRVPEGSEEDSGSAERRRLE